MGGKPPKMDGENFMENPMNKWMIWGYYYFWVDTHIYIYPIYLGYLKDAYNLVPPRCSMMFLETGLRGTQNLDKWFFSSNIAGNFTNHFLPNLVT